jgi:probable addiction module antidote protein
MKKEIIYDDWLSQELQDPKLAIAYLNEALKDEDERMFLIAFKKVLKAFGDQDITTLAKEVNLTRRNLYRIFSEKVNPRWNSLKPLVEKLGMQIQLTFKEDTPVKNSKKNK